MCQKSHKSFQRTTGQTTTDNARETAYLRYMGQQTCGPTCAQALIRPHVFCGFGEYIS